MDTTDIKWQRGNFMKFQARMKIRLGGSNPVDIYEGDDFEYDGTILKYGGAEINTPQTRGAFRNGWFIRAGADAGGAKVRSVQPGRNVAAAQSVNRDLNNVQRAGGKGIQTSSLDEQTVLDVSERRDPSPNARPNALHGGKRLAVSDDGTSDGVVIGQVRSPARVKVDDTTKVSDQQVRAIEERTLGKPIFNENARRVVQKEGVTIKTPPSMTDEVLSEEDDGVEVAKVRSSRATRSDGITVEDTSNIRSRPKAASAAPKAPKLDSKLPPRIRIARAIDPSFPEGWSFTGKLADRLAAVKAHGATKQFVNALYAAEGDQMRKKLEEVYPKLLG